MCLPRQPLPQPNPQADFQSTDQQQMTATDPCLEWCQAAVVGCLGEQVGGSDVVVDLA